MPENFLIKHSSSGKFFHPSGGSSNPGNGTSVVLHSDRHSNMHWTFEKIDGHWGYIKHVASGKIIHPSGGSLNPGNGTGLVVHSDRHYGALFALDAANDRVMHKGGKFAHPSGGSPNPGNGTKAVLHSDIHDAMRFKFVSTTDPNKEILVYGYPTMAGQWKIINLVQDPIAEHTSEIQVKIGKSREESTTTSFQYTWESTAGIQADIFSASVSQSLSFMFEKTSSTTWTEESTRTTTIKVKPGKTVVTWHYVFDVQQNQSKGVFRSNLLADTSSETDVPEDLQYELE